MTERELTNQGPSDVLRRDGVMQRLAKLLADGSTPSQPRVRLMEALVRGDFAAMFETGDATAD